MIAKKAKLEAGLSLIDHADRLAGCIARMNSEARTLLREGGVNFNYIAGAASATVEAEDTAAKVANGLRGQADSLLR